uniref:Phosphofructokinase domain-containing protein n=1 Tax=Populus trichocarpa TaxID=3694 RepID=A0A3N7FAL9_POPTR
MIDNDIAVIDKSFGIDTAVEEAQRATNAAHVEVETSLRFESCRFHCNVCNFGKLRHAEGTGQEYVAQNMHAVDEGDASGNRLLLDVGLWLTQKVKDHFTKVKKMEIDMKYIDPTYMIRAIPSNASENISCTLLAQSAVQGAMGGYTGFTVGPVNSRRAYIPISRVTEAQNTVKLTEDVGLTACFYKSA